MPPTPPPNLNHERRRDEPPPVRRKRGRIVVLAIAGALVAAILILIAFNIDRTEHARHAAPDDPNVVELVPPERLRSEDIKGDMSQMSRNLQELGAENTWIQTTDKNGNIAQQYRFASHDPSPEGLPAGWSKVNKPEIEMYLSDDRVVTLRSDTALLRAPSQTVESGTMTGDVVIRMYELAEPRIFDRNTAPALEAKTNEASFDNIQGEIRVDGHVDVQTATAHLPGDGLRVQINEVENRVESLKLEKPGTIRLASIKDNAPPSTQPEVADETPGSRPTRANAGHSAATQPNRRKNAGPVFYHLTLAKNVHVRQGDDQTGWNADGDELHLFFSAEGKGLGRTLAQNGHDDSDEFDRTVDRSALPQTPTTLLTSLVIALPQSAPDGGLFHENDDDIIVTCDGTLTMAPVTNAADRPKSRDDARLELVGQPVRLHSFPDQAIVNCRNLTYHTQAQLIVLKSSAASPLTIDSPQLRGSGERFRLSRLTNKGAFEGPGWIDTREQPPNSDQASPASQPQTHSDLHIAWNDRVDLAFAQIAKSSGSRDSIGKLKQADFKGDVQVTSDEITLRADALTAGFVADSGSGGDTERDERGIDFIKASGAVAAMSRTDQGSLACDELAMEFARTAEGRTIPAHMLATGAVAAVDRDHQTVWSDRFEVFFQSPEEVQSARANSNQSPAASRNAQVKTLNAQGDVQVLTADGARAFADRLDADAASGIVMLTGDNVMAMNQQALLYGGTKLELHKTDSSASWPGPGEFAYFTNPIPANASERIPRPVVSGIDPQSNPIQVHATWTSSMSYDGTVNDGAGSLTLHGTVHGESWPNPLEHNTVDGDSVTMQFIHAANADGENAHAAPVSSEATNPLAAGGKRELKLFIAEGDAKIENHTWELADHSDVSRIFYIAGPKIIYDDQTLEANVPGAGSLLVRDERVEPGATHSANAASPPLSSKGTTQFKWTDHLQMTRQTSSLFDIEMSGDVKVIHQALDKSISTIVAKQLFATVERMGETTATGPRQSGMDLGGSMELRRIRGLGNIYIKTPARDIACESIDYDYSSGDAILAALPGQNVTIMTTGKPDPLHAERVIWNMKTDSISATNVRGTGPR